MIDKTTNTKNTILKGVIVKIAFFIFSCFSILLISRENTFAEGTRQLMPTATDFGYIQLFDLNTITRPFASYNCPAENRLNIRICNAGEIIYMGFQQTNNDVYFRLKNPLGATVTIPGLVPVAPNTYLLPAAGMGRITSYAQAFNGPSVIAGGGYNAMSYTTTMAGDYYIEFNPVSPTVITPVKRIFNYFDITVATAANARINGRVWSQTWDFTTNGGANRFRAIMHVYSDDGIVTALNFNGMQPHGFTMSCNATGCTDTGDPVADRASRFGNSTYAQYKIFLNDPDPACFPTGTFGTLTAPSTITGCGDDRCINVSVDKPGNVGILLDLNGVLGYQAGTTDRQLFATVVPGTNCIPWDGRDGLGNLVTSGFTFSMQVDYYNGITHLPLYDVEDNPNGYIVTLNRPAGPAPRLFWDDAAITTGVATDGLVNLTGCSLATGCHRWRTRGNNANPETINTWWYANIITERLTVTNGSITTDADTRKVGVGSSNDTTICGILSPSQLSGGITGATGGEWTTSGSGTFAPNITALNATYTPSAADIANGFVYLKLTSTGNGPCPAVSDSLRMSFQPAPIVNAGGDQIKCSNNASTVLAGSFSNASGIRWTGGLGTFVPNNTTINATYTPTAAEIAAGTVTLTLTTLGNGVCNAANDQMQIVIEPAPTVNTGINQIVCANNPAITLAGLLTNATSQNWSGGTGIYTPNNTSANTIYTPSAAEITAGSVTLTLNANRLGCNTVSDPITIAIQPAPIVNAGVNQSVCHNNANVTLNGTVTGTTTYAWTGAGTFSPNNTTLNAVYTPTLTERNNGTATLTLTATRSGCNPVTDQMSITITPAPIVNAVADKLTVCANNSLVNLTGTSTTGSGVWSGGCGMFVPGTGNLNNQYTPCATEISTGTAALILTSSNNGNCLAVQDTVRFIIIPAPTSDAGIDRSVCANNPALTLAGIATNASSTLWSGGTGTYTSGANVLTTQYIPSAAEISSGSATLTLTVSRTSCNPVTDQMVISITPRPTVNAGADRSVCHNNPALALNGVVTIASGGTWTGGSGTYAPNANTLNATYTPTLTERNAGSVTLTLTTTGNGNCNAVNDQMTITITAPPTANAGIDRTVCANNPSLTLSGSATNASGAIWSGGGSFSPNTASLNPVFTPSAAQITAGTTVLTLTTTGNGNCNPVNDQMRITITPAPVVNAGTDRSVCADNPAVILNGSVTTANGGIWSGGAGIFNPNNTTLDATYTPTAAEINIGSVSLTLTSTGNGICNPVSDVLAINITPAPTVHAGADQIVCGNVANVPLSGTVTVSTGGLWSTSGTGSFSNASGLTTTYIPSAADRTNGTVTLTLTTTGNGLCNAISDNLTVTFTDVPSIFAGPDQTVCANNLPIRLNASGSPATWTGGTGTFSPNANALNATYNPSAGEIASGAITLTITTIPSGACPAVSDQVRITMPPAPLANAGSDRTMCGNLASVGLTGAVLNASGGFWSTTGTGSFTPNASTLNATYTPSALDKTNGSVTLSLTTTGNGTCTGHTDQMVLTIQPAIAVNAGPNQNVCGDVAGISLNGSVVNAIGAVWTSSGTGSFSPNNVALNATYIPSATDKTNGSVTLTLSTSGNGVCPVQTDQVVFTIRQVPIANAGADQTVCADVANINLSGSVIRATGGMWTSSGSGTFSNPSSLNTTYFPSAIDKASGTVTFTLTTTGSGICAPASDQKIYTINPAPTVSAGADRVICADAGTIQLNGSVTVASGVNWSSSGTGTFNNSAIANAVYTPSANDISNGGVTLTITTTGNGLCNAVSDPMIITITPAPTVNAGFDKNICANGTATLNGIITIASGAVWSTSGTGSFTPNTTSLNAVYNPSPADTASGTVTLTLTTTGNGTCNSYQDPVIVTIKKLPVVNAGADQVVCADSLTIQLNGTVLHAGGGLWSSSGTGNFFPSTTSLNAVYVPSNADRTLGNIVLTLTSTNNSPCTAVSDQLNIIITPAPTVNAGSDQLICGDSAYVNLNGAFTIASGAAWSSSGTGTFSPDNTTMNARYIPSPEDILAGAVTISLTTTGNGTCKPVTDNLIITITPAPTVDAGISQTICANVGSFNLNGTVTTAAGGLWSTTGSGGFSPDVENLNATYFITAADTATGSVIFTLTTTGNGTCKAVSDQMTIVFDKVPLVNAGADQTICASSSGVAIKGKVFNAIGGTWSGGTGSFAPNTNSLNATYVPSSTDTVAGSVTLTLASTGNGTCPAVTDQVTITIEPLPIVNAGPDQIVCADAGGVQLAGLIYHAPGGTWSTNGTGSLVPNSWNLNAQYSITDADTTAGSIVMTLTSISAVCGSASDNMTISFTPAPTVNAGPDISVCTGLNAVGINLQGRVTVATGAYWSTNGSGTFSDENSLSTIYYPTIADEAAGSVTITLVTTGNGSCNFYTDAMNLSFAFPVSIISAGNDTTFCTNGLPVQLNGSGTTGRWSGGLGTYTPNDSTLNAQYIPHPTEITSGSVTLTITAIGMGACTPATDEVTILLPAGPTANANADQTICTNSPAVALNGSVTVASGGRWTSSGSGVFADANSTITTYTPSASDETTGTVTFTLTTTGNSGCNASSDRMIVSIIPGPTIQAGLDQVVCSNTTINLHASFTNAAGMQWVGGNGTYTPDDTSPDAEYTPTAAEIASGSITLTAMTLGTGVCPPATDDQVIINFTPAPVANAGNDKLECSSVSNVSLNGLVQVATGGFWTTTGSGIFTTAPSSLNTSYKPSSSDTAAGSVKLVLSTTGNGTCNAVTDTMLLEFVPLPIVNAGLNDTICSIENSVALNGSFANSSGILWSSSGNGIFTPDRTSLNPTYQPSVLDKSNGSVNIILTSTNNGPCPVVADNTIIKIITSPIAKAGLDKVICSDKTDIQLSGTVSMATGGIWSSNGTGTFTPDNTTLLAKYVPSATDTTNGSVILTLTTTGSGICAAATDEVGITFIPAPLVSAGSPPNQTICADATSINLNGSVTNAQGGLWTTSGTGYFSPDAASLTATYIPSEKDKTNGSVGLTLTSTGNNVCNAAKDNFLITITPAPKINAGADKLICAHTSSVSLNGIVSAATGGTWTTSGNGTFGNPNALTTAYFPSVDDTTNKMVILTLTSTGHGICSAVRDQLKITFEPVPLVNAGPDQTLCADNQAIPLNGIAINTNGIWSTSGSGTFSDVYSLTSTYSPSSLDTANGSILLTLTTWGNNVCNPITDQMLLTLQPVPVVNAGSAMICEINLGAQLHGTVMNAGGGNWSTSGSGSFSMNTDTLNAIYYPSLQDAVVGNVTLTLSSTANGVCSAVTHQTVLAIDPLPIANAGQDKYICRGSSTTLNAFTSDNVSYNWSLLNGTVVATTPTVTISASADTDFVLTVTDAKGCFSRDTLRISVYDLPDFNLNPHHCLSNSLIIDSDPQNLPSVPGIFQWYRNNVIITNENTPVILPYETGTYKITYSYGNCSYSETTNVTKPPVLSHTNIIACEATTADITIHSNVNNVMYDWSTGNSGTDLKTITIQVPIDTTYFAATVIDVLGCTNTDSVRVIGVPVPQLNMMDSIAACSNTKVILDAKPVNLANLNPYNPEFKWFKKPTPLTHNDDTLVVTLPGTYVVNLTVGLCTVKDSTVVHFNPLPVSVQPDEVKFCKEKDKYIVLDGGEGIGYSYYWTSPPGTVLDSNITQTIGAEYEGFYYVTVTNAFNCSVSDSVFVNEVCPPRLYVPNAFTPNVLGLDNNFKVFGAYFINYQMTVFNRWGEIIFMSYDRNESWDGTYLGEPMPVGVYPWVVTYEGEDPEMRGPYRQEGTVTIVR